MSNRKHSQNPNHITHEIILSQPPIERTSGLLRYSELYTGAPGAKQINYLVWINLSQVNGLNLNSTFKQITALLVHLFREC